MYFKGVTVADSRMCKAIFLVPFGLELGFNITTPYVACTKNKLQLPGNASEVPKREVLTGAKAVPIFRSASNILTSQQFPINRAFSHAAGCDVIIFEKCGHQQSSLINRRQFQLLPLTASKIVYGLAASQTEVLETRALCILYFC